MNNNPAPPRRALRPGLASQLVLVLSIAILPLGLISVYQTNNVLQERQSLSEAALLARTQEAVSESREVLRSAIGAAQTLAVQVPALRSDQDTCDTVMSKVVERSGTFAFAGYRDNDRGLICSSKPLSGGEDENLTALPALDTTDDEVLMRPLEFLGGIATLSVTVPVIEEGRHFGTIWIAVPITALNTALSRTREAVDLVLFRNDGDIVATEDLTDFRRSVLPETRSLQDLSATGQQTFRTLSREGKLRDFAVSPIVEGRVFVLGSWIPQDRGIEVPAAQHAMALYFPILIWAIAVGVAYIGVHRLVLRNLSRLRGWMRDYASGRTTDFDQVRLDGAPEELEVLADSFRAMIRRLSEQDHRREEDLREKNVLLREVHHRVKNNLQLISSMMNMQIRGTQSLEAQRLLRRVQDRITALSAIHRYLYLARKLSTLRADKLLEDIIQQMVIVGTLEETGQHISVSTKLDPVEINPDQSVPLSLLATEAATNAVKYCGVTDDGGAWINIALKSLEDGNLCLSIVNSRADGSGEDGNDETGTSGLGSRLIESFAKQLNGTLEIKDLPHHYELHVVFPLAWHDAHEGKDEGDQAEKTTD